MAHEGFHEAIADLSPETIACIGRSRPSSKSLKRSTGITSASTRARTMSFERSSYTIATKRRSTPRCCWSGFAAAMTSFKTNSRTTCSPTSQSLRQRSSTSIDTKPSLGRTVAACCDDFHQLSAIDRFGTQLVQPGPPHFSRPPFMALAVSAITGICSPCLRY